MPDFLQTVLICGALLIAGCASAPLEPDAPIDCASCKAWNEPLAPFHIYGNTYYVGTARLASILLDAGDGLILLDGGLPQSALLIDRNVRKLGLDPRDIKLILVSHVHYDHVGGVAALARLTGATVITSAAAVPVLRAGRLGADDPQYDPAAATNSFPAVPAARSIADGDSVAVGTTRVRAVYTPGHTPGGVSWTWQACESALCLEVVYADSIGPAAPAAYRFSDGMGDEMRRSIARIAALDCDIFLSTHDFSFGLHDKLARGREAFIDPAGCKQYVARTLQSLERRLAREAAENPR